MYSAPYQEAAIGCGLNNGWEQIGDGVPLPETPDSAAAGQRSRYRYRVTGFGCHTEYKTVEFLEELFATRFCSWCGLVASEMYILSCMHVICPVCQERAFNPALGYAVCLIDKEVLCADVTGIIPNNVQFKLVRCPSEGCDFTGYLRDLNDHLGQSCAFYLTTCAKCNSGVAHKDMPNHFWTCQGAPGVFLQAADVHTLLEDLGNVRKELDSALLCSANSGLLENAVVAVTGVFEKLSIQFGMVAPTCPAPGPDGGADAAK